MNLVRPPILLAVLLLATAAPAEPLLVGNIPHNETTLVQGQRLQLNGAGIRYKTLFKVYTAALYLEKKAGTFQEVTAQEGPKRLVITMLRDIDSSELGRLFSRGMEDNLEKGRFSPLVPGVLRMSRIFSDHKRLAAGEQFTIDWLPGAGTLITVKGQPQGEPFREPEFFNALLGIWLGPKPADGSLKHALLGNAS